eukprot:TRINITY_DN5825_c0_g1_i1.p1 TRINITY_DN5825_c0_g1~~TRINITY_DN5825_c0_g1_i1.p1  ORF type:complete len:580 (+),score=202.30 TRINITY_DN5825_c0_g1_i1:68-1741(+)
MAAARCALLCLLAAAGRAAAYEIVVGLPLRSPEALEKLFWKISTPGSGEYLKHRSVAELAAIVGAPVSQVDKTKEWLRALGAAPETIRVSALGDTVSAEIQEPTALAAQWAEKAPPAAAAPVAVDFVLRRGGAEGKKVAAAAVQQERAGRVQGLFGPTIAQQKKALGIPTDLMASNPATLQMVWGPGTFGYSPASLNFFKDAQCPLMNTTRISFDTKNHGESGGDNFGEGNLDVRMIASFGLNVATVVSNTNTSSATEEGSGFGQALLDFITELASRKTVPQVLSMSLGSLSAASCDLLCTEAAKRGHTLKECQNYMQQQRQVCMYLSEQQVARINQAFQLLGARGVSLFGSSGDGGSHFSFGKFSGGALATVLNEISCQYQMPVFPTSSPYVTSVGGTSWSNDNPDKPVSWSHAGGGFSWEFGMPEHQKQAVGAYLKKSGMPPSSSFNATGRAYPDLACISTEGTSESSPSMAGIFSMVNDHRLNKGLPPLGFLGPRLYQTNEQHPGVAFEDITSGNTKTTCDNGFPATSAWDAASGWGRPKWTGLLSLFGSDNAL